MMACHFVSVVLPVGIGEKFYRATTKLVARAAGDKVNMSCGSLKLCAGFEAGIDRENHDMVKRRQERTAKALGETAKYELEQRSSTGDTNDGRGEDADAVGGIGEVLGPSEDGSATGEGESSNDLITVMEAMEVRMEELAEWDELEVDKDSVEEEGGDWGGGCCFWKP